MLREIGTCIAYFDELDTQRRQSRHWLSYTVQLTPVPLSTTNGTEGSIVGLDQ